jgi:hypothetical protein
MQEEGGRVRPGRRPVLIRLRRVSGMECGGATTTPSQPYWKIAGREDLVYVSSRIAK